MYRILTILFVLAAMAGPAGLFAQQQLRYPSAEFWSDPVNINRFLGTYGQRAEVEPRISQEESLVFRTVIEQMRTDRELALSTLLAALTPEVSAALDFTVGNIYFEKREFENAIRYYRQAIRKFPDFMRAHKNLGIMLVQRGLFEEAIEPLSRAINLGAADGITFGLLGLSYINRGRPLLAEVAYKNALLMDPNTFDWKIGLARSLLEQSKFVEAIALLDEILLERIDDAQLWLVQANAFLGHNQPQLAAANYEVVRGMGRATIDSLMLLGDIYMNDNMRELALEVYLEGVLQDPNQSIDRPLRAAEVMADRGAFAQSSELLATIREQFATRIADRHELSILRLEARIAIATGDGEAAFQILDEIVNRDPFDGRALLLLARFHRNSDEIEKAAIFYERAAQIREFEVEAWVQHAQMLVSQNEFSKAIPLLERAQNREPRETVGRYLEAVRRAAQTIRM